jgi:GcrA cell cycle regulator
MVNWTEKRLQRLKLLHRGGLSASAIAKKLGPDFTKGMVAGKIRRLGLKPPKKRSATTKPKPPHVPNSALPSGRVGKRVSKPAPLVPAPAPIIAPPAAPLLTPAANTGADSMGVRLYDLRQGHCRWPLGDDRPAKFFCGAPIVPSKPWCERHYQIAYGHRPPRQKQQSKSAAELLLLAIRQRAKRRPTRPAERPVRT